MASDEFILKALAGLSEGVNEGLQIRRKNQAEAKRLAIEEEDRALRRSSLDRSRELKERQLGISQQNVDLRTKEVAHKGRESAARAGRQDAAEDTRVSAELRKLDDDLMDAQKEHSRIMDDISYEKDEARAAELSSELDTVNKSIDTLQDSKRTLLNRPSRKGKTTQVKVTPDSSPFATAQSPEDVANAYNRLSEGMSEVEARKLAKEAATKIKSMNGR